MLSLQAIGYKYLLFPYSTCTLHTSKQGMYIPDMYLPRMKRPYSYFEAVARPASRMPVGTLPISRLQIPSRTVP